MTTWEETIKEIGSTVRYKAPHTGTGIFSSVPYDIVASERQVIKLETDTMFILPLRKGEEVFAKYPIDLVRLDEFTEDFNK